MSSFIFSCCDASLLKIEKCNCNCSWFTELVFWQKLTIIIVILSFLLTIILVPILLLYEQPKKPNTNTGKDVLVLSTYDGEGSPGKERPPMIISFSGEHNFEKNYSSNLLKGDYRKASFPYDSDTEISSSCSVEYENEFYVFGGRKIENQVNK